MEVELETVKPPSRSPDQRKGGGGGGSSSSSSSSSDSDSEPDITVQRPGAKVQDFVPEVLDPDAEPAPLTDADIERERQAAAPAVNEQGRLRSNEAMFLHLAEDNEPPPAPAAAGPSGEAGTAPGAPAGAAAGADAAAGGGTAEAEGAADDFSADDIEEMRQVTCIAGCAKQRGLCELGAPYQRCGFEADGCYPACRYFQVRKYGSEYGSGRPVPVRHVRLCRVQGEGKQRMLSNAGRRTTMSGGRRENGSWRCKSNCVRSCAHEWLALIESSFCCHRRWHPPRTCTVRPLHDASAAFAGLRRPGCAASGLRQGAACCSTYLHLSLHLSSACAALPPPLLARPARPPLSLHSHPPPICMQPPILSEPCPVPAPP